MMNDTLLNKFNHGDSLEIMRGMPDSSVDLVVTSPPYNIVNSSGNYWTQKKRNANKSRWSNLDGLRQGYECHDDNMPHDKYVDWQRQCLTEMLRIIPDNGAIYYIHKWRVQNGLIQDRSDILKDFPVRQMIIWQRSGGINFCNSFYLPTFEVVYLIAGKDFMLVDKANTFGDVWTIHQDTNNKHPAPFPLELAERIIVSTDAKTVLDPFMGSGTTSVAAYNLGRDFIGIDNSEKYCSMAEKRLKSVTNQRSIFEEPVTNIAKQL